MDLVVEIEVKWKRKSIWEDMKGVYYDYNWE